MEYWSVVHPSCMSQIRCWNILRSCFSKLPYLRAYLLISVLLCTSLALEAQGNFELERPDIYRHAHKAPFFVSHSTKALSRYLTKPYSSQEDKVRSITYWITHNIQYDVKSARKNDLRNRSMFHILWRRKAICGGYSDLFASLCLAAGIDAYRVEGYSKAGAYEPTDIFVRKDHAWSAVEIDGRWRLLDLTWASGYAEDRKMTLRKWLWIYLRIPYPQKQRFVKAYNGHYIFTDPADFSLDHLPEHPWWQLTPATMPVEVFEAADSTILEFHTTEGRPRTYQSSDIRPFERMPAPERHLVLGQEAHTYNPQNHAAPAEGNVKYVVQTLFENDKDNVIHCTQKLEVYDSLLTLLEDARFHNGQYRQMCRLERSIRKDKNKQLKQHSIRVIKSESRNARNMMREQRAALSALRNTTRGLYEKRSALSRYREELDDFEWKPYKGGWQHMSHTDTLMRANERVKQAMDQLAAINDSIQQLAPTFTNALRGQFLESRTTGKDRLAVFSQKSEWLDQVIGAKRTLRFYFSWFERPVLDTLTQLQLDASAARQQDHTQFMAVTEHYTDNEDLLWDHGKLLLRQYRSKMRTLARLERYGATTLPNEELCMDMYYATLRAAELLVDQLDSARYEALQTGRLHRVLVTNAKRMTKRELKSLHRETRLEMARYAWYNRSYLHQYLRYVKQSRQFNKYTQRVKDEVKKAIRSCEEEIKQEERAIKKEEEHEMNRTRNAISMR